MQQPSTISTHLIRLICIGLLIISSSSLGKTQMSTMMVFPCPILEDSVIMQFSDCNDLLEVCVPLPLASVLSGAYDMKVNGQPYDSNFGGCDFDSTIVYSYFTLFGQGEAGPYMLNDWNVNGQDFSGQFQDMQDLVNQMNVWDPDGNWILSSNNFSIEGGNVELNFYGDLKIEHIQSGLLATLGINYGETALGTMFYFEPGIYEFIITNIDVNCADTMTILAPCIQAETQSLTVYVGLANSGCIDQSELIGDIVSIDACGSINTNTALLMMNDSSYCFDYMGIGLGSTSTCYVICDEYGFCDTTMIQINVIPVPPGEVIVETIVIGEIGVSCLSTEDLQGIPVSLEMGCAESWGDNVIFDLDEGNLCVSYEGINVGIDTACAIICDNLGACDTTLIYISVIDPVILLPIGVIDYDTTEQGQSTSIRVTANDTIDYLNSLAIISQPSDGSVFVNIDNTISYQPDEEFCGSDAFQYEICNAAGCDTVDVLIQVMCNDVHVYNGFSPNGDGINDRFRIEGLSPYPTCLINVYNAWGALVYTNNSEGYDYSTAWEGRWNGKELPDADYFYVINLNDGTGRNYSGYVLLQR